jgi:hypothetical protein
VNQSFPNPLAPMAAVEEVKKANPELVDRFQLRFEPGGVIADSWYVLVWCGIDSPDAYELGDTLKKLERQIEAKSGLDVTLMLSNSPHALNGKHA